MQQALFATSPSPKMSTKYQFVPTSEITGYLATKGWNISTYNQKGQSSHGRHQVKLRHEAFKIPREGDIELIINTSHDGQCAFNLMLGLYRLVCSNGLIASRSIFNFKRKHLGHDFKSELDNALVQVVEKAAKLKARIDLMKSAQLTDQDKRTIAQVILVERFKGTSVSVMPDVNDLFKSTRIEDSDNSVWAGLNIVQEKMLQGGLLYATRRDNKDSVRTMRRITSIEANARLNTLIFEQFNNLVA